MDGRILKLDQNLVRDVDNTQRVHIARTVTDLARALRLGAIAESVGRKEQAESLLASVATSAKDGLPARRRMCERPAHRRTWTASLLAGADHVLSSPARDPPRASTRSGLPLANRASCPSSGVRGDAGAILHARGMSHSFSLRCLHA